MDILQSRESLENRLELLTESFLRVLDLSCVESCIDKAFSQMSIVAKISQAWSICQTLPMNWVASTSDTADLKTRTNHSRKLSLGSTENDIDELLARGHRCDLIVEARSAVGHRKKMR